MDAAHALHLACAEARKWLGATSPNPPVGAAALDAEGNLIAVAAHHKAGEAHAEAALLKLCHEQGTLSKIHTLCVTLEPCNHHGRTPPCSEAIIAAGIKHVVVGITDPNPHVKGGGIARLREAGIRVTVGLNEAECEWLIHAFSHSVRTGMPWITVKRAFDEHGSMIPPMGQTTFTSPASLRLSHQLRKKADAIITGSGTILADAPRFTVRHVPEIIGKRRHLIIMDRRGRVPQSYLDRAREDGFEASIHTDIHKAIQYLAGLNVRDVLAEAGPAISQAILESGLWTMRVDIHKGEPDKIDVEFNPRHTSGLSTDAFSWDHFLPAETD